MSSAASTQVAVALCTFLAGLLIAVDLAPGPAFGVHSAWAGAIKIAHGYLAYMGLNAGVTAAVSPRSDPAPSRRRAWADGFD